VGYPARYECDVVMSDGTVAHLRPIRPTDADPLVAFHEGLSRETVYLRFFGVHPHLRPTEVEHFVSVDYRDRLALVVEIGGALAAVARYDRTPGTDRAEVAFVVTDARQGLGLGTLLLEHLAAAARAQGISAFFAETLGDNRPMLEVFQQVGFGCHRKWEGGVVDLSFPIEPTQTYLDAVIHRELLATHRLLQPLVERIERRVPAGNVGLICQSVARTAAIAGACRSGPLGVSSLVVAGHDLDAEVHDLLGYLALDPSTEVIGLELSHLARPRRFVALARATSWRKPIVVLVPPAERWLGSGADLAGAEAGIWEQSGVEVVERVEDFIRRLKRLVVQRRTKTWTAPVRGALAEISGCQLRRARVVLDTANSNGSPRAADRAPALPPEATTELFAAYGVISNPGAAAFLPSAVCLTIGQDPVCGLSASLTSTAAGDTTGSCVRSLPLTEIDVDDLVRSVGAQLADTPVLGELIERSCRLVEDQPEICHLELPMSAAGLPLDPPVVLLGPVRSTQDDPFVRRVVPPVVCVHS